MAKAKKIRRQTDRLAKQKLKKSGQLKGLSRKEKKRKIAVAGLQERNKIRQFMRDERMLRQEQFQKDMDARRDKARAEGKKLVYDAPTTPSFSSVTPNTNPSKNKGKAEEARRIQKNNERIRKNQEAMRKAAGGAYQKTMQDGSVRTVVTKMKGESDADFKKRIEKAKKTRSAKHGGALAIMIAPVKTKKMKAVKKAPGGASMGKMKMMKKGGKLKMVKGPDGKMVPFYAADGKGKMMYGGSMKKKMAMGGRMGSKEMMESMKKDDKMLKNGGKVGDPKRKYKKGKLDMVNKVAKNPMSKKGLSLAERARKAQQILEYKRKGRASVKKEGYKSKMMYGGSMKKAMYGAKMKKKAMYGAKMKK